MRAWRIAQQQAQIDDAQALAPFTHVFSHYRLNIEPLLFDRATAQRRIADNPQLRWCSADELAALGLPAPVRSLLLQINDNARAGPQAAPITLAAPPGSEP